MPMTPLTSATSYASAADLVNCYDENKIGQWATDSKKTITYGDIIAPDPKVAAALLRASGMVEAACLRGKRYTPDDLAVLTGAGLGLLKGLVCDLAAYYLARRRIPEPEKYTNYKDSMETIKALGLGEMIFGFVEIAEAGNMESFDTSLDSASRFQRPTEVAKRFFGERSDSMVGNPIQGNP